MVHPVFDPEDQVAQEEEEGEAIIIKVGEEDSRTITAAEEGNSTIERTSSEEEFLVFPSIEEDWEITEELIEKTRTLLQE